MKGKLTHLEGVVGDGARDDEHEELGHDPQDAAADGDGVGLVVVLLGGGALVVVVVGDVAVARLGHRLPGLLRHAVRVEAATRRRREPIALV